MSQGVQILQICSESSDSDRFQNLQLLESRHDLAQRVTTYWTSWSLTSQWNILSRYYSLFIQALKKFLIARNSQTWERARHNYYPLYLVAEGITYSLFEDNVISNIFPSNQFFRVMYIAQKLLSFTVRHVQSQTNGTCNTITRCHRWQWNNYFTE